MHRNADIRLNLDQLVHAVVYRNVDLCLAVTRQDYVGAELFELFLRRHHDFEVEVRLIHRALGVSERSERSGIPASVSGVENYRLAGQWFVGVRQ